MSDWVHYNDEYPPPKADEPALHRAARCGDHAEIRKLVHNGADIEAVFDLSLDPDMSPWCATPLMVAAGSGDGATVETVELLLVLGADPRAVTSAGAGTGSAVSFACMGIGWNYRPGGDADRLRLLLRLGSPLLPDSSEAAMSLCCSASDGDAERVCVLLDHGVSPNTVWTQQIGEKRRENFLRYSRKNNKGFPYEVPVEVQPLIDEAVDTTTEQMGDHFTAGPGDHEIPLFCAAESGNAECVRALFEAGADPMQRDSSKRTAMYSAASTEVVELLMKISLPLEDADEYGWSPLDNAVSSFETGLPIARALLACGADPNATHDRGYTVFMSAVGSGRTPAMLRLLIEHGADPLATSELGYNAFHAAVDVNNDDASVRDTLGYLHELGVDIEHRNQEGETPLSRAINRGCPVEVIVLCDVGADPNAACRMIRCADGSCAYHDAPSLVAVIAGACAQKAGKTRALLESGADPLAADDEGYTAMLHAASKLCADAEDDEAAYQEFFGGLKQLEIMGSPCPETQKAFIANASPIIRRYVTAFAEPIPVPQTYGYDQEWRDELIDCLELLLSHGAWALLQRGLADDPDPDKQ